MDLTSPRFIVLILFLGASRVYAQYDQCAGYTPWIGDSWCDDDNNNAACGYDGGDCCYCSCADGREHTCGVVGFDCRDPEYLGDEISDCIEELKVDAPCSTDISTQLVVNDTASATVLAETVRCSSGGTFNVEWFGYVVVNRTINVANGTVLHVTGVGSGAEMHAGSDVRLFTVVNASLDIKKLKIAGGHATFGGGIAAADSYISLENTRFEGNGALLEGGALYATHGSTTSCGEGTIFDGNHAGFQGGALSFGSASSAMFHGYSSFRNCTTDGYGGALYVSSSSVSLAGQALFSNNTAREWGGAMCVFSSTVSWAGDASFFDNTANEIGGALFVSSSNVSWTSHFKFSNNAAKEDGGALYVSSSSVSWAGQVLFSNNTAEHWGGAMYVFSSTVSWAGNASFVVNTANEIGGALFVSSSNVSCTGDFEFSNNIAEEDGGALYVSSSSVSWAGQTIFANNTAYEFGGALFVLASNASWSANALFYGNTAYIWGGALYVSSSDVSWAANTLFCNNTAHGLGGALLLRESNASLAGDSLFSDNTAFEWGGALAIVFSSVSWTGDALFFSNAAIGWGGAAFVSDSYVSWAGNALFSENMGDEGGALMLSTSSVLWAGTVEFSNNIAKKVDGGALFVSSSVVAWEGDSFFWNNTADAHGGAISLYESRPYWAGNAFFFHNIANEHGGALLVYASNVSWTANSSFDDNAANDWGGALHVTSSNVSWAANAFFCDNTAYELGGALFVQESNISCTGDSLFSDNTAFEWGGALVIINSSVSWTGDASFSGNYAYFWGGALLVSNSHVSWAGNSLFSNNMGDEGGALLLLSSSASWTGNVLFSGNYAYLWGGALVLESSSVSWSGTASFSDNFVHVWGGALVVFSSKLSWTGHAAFSNNTADDDGGALFVISSNLSWEGDAVFSNNTANDWGGALYVSSSSISWAGNALFAKNTARKSGGALEVRSSDICFGAQALFLENAAGRNGGALYIIDGAKVFLGLDTVFLRNSASGDGGAVYIYSNDDGTQASSLCVISTMSFQNNSSGGDGGALAVVAAGVVSFASANVIFFQNSAHAAGGALSVKGSRLGPQFRGLTLVSNQAQIGGAVHVTSSGTATTQDQFGVSIEHPTTIDRCRFIGNEAWATGGAIDTGAGLDVIVNTYFASNTARAGGALRLAGITSLHNCTFTENTSKNDEGPAVSNVGFVSAMTACSFVDNCFQCDHAEFLDYLGTNNSNGVVDVVCKGCDAECHHCTVRGGVPACAEELEHTSSIGGNTTIEKLKIDPGYWRATNTSTKVLPCFNAGACLGGVTGASNYCSSGYEGPYCSTCREGFSPGLGHTCSKCSGRIDSVIVSVMIAIISAILVAVFLLSYLTCGMSAGSGRGLLASLWRRQLLSLKIVIIVWQVITQFASVANVMYPGVYQRFLDGVHILNFDLSWFLSAECIIDLNFHHRLIISTLGPPIALSVLGGVYAILRRRNRTSYYDFMVVSRQEVRCNLLSLALLLAFLVYSSVSSTLFQMFACDGLDNGKSYLRADYRIDCDSSTHRSLQVYAALMMVFYTGGIPVLYGILLFSNKQVLMDGRARQEDAAAKSISSLWALYKPNRFCYELIEFARRILLAGVVVFIFPNTVAQVAVALMIAAFFMVLSEMLAPYESPWDSWVNRIGHATIFCSIYLALLLKIDVSGERGESQRLFEILLIAGNACMVFLLASASFLVMYRWMTRAH